MSNKDIILHISMELFAINNDNNYDIINILIEHCTIHQGIKMKIMNIIFTDDKYEPQRNYQHNYQLVSNVY